MPRANIARGILRFVLTPRQRCNRIPPMQLTARDEQILNGEYGPAPQTAMRILTQLGEVVGADEMLDVEQVHVDGCIYESEAHLDLPKNLPRSAGA
ncbi:MAG: hypothetical protein HDKAJFGB_02712 [Anaerolineae bacterium]|nr:hypothetical protein [Anaerolineae bacterium]